MHQNKHLVIGAGPVGLAQAKSLKMAAIPYDQVDADDDVGGNWYHGTYQTAHIISSKKVTEYADWPMPDDYPDFPSRQNMVDYFRAYAAHFELRENIEFKRKVVYIQPVEDNLWKVYFEDGEERVYKGVLVCNGHHWHRKFPEYEGEFTGEYIHSKDYQHPDQLKDKRVLVIGAGNSACDIVSEAARVSTKAYLSMRRGVWFLPKTFLGKPITDSPLVGAPIWLQRLVMKFMLKLTVGSYEDYGLESPKDKIFERHPTVSSEVLHYIKHGRIEPKRGIERLDGQQIHFVDGSHIEVDMIVAATGFHVSYPFLPQKLNRVEGAVVKAYGGSMLDDYKGLYLVGWGQPRGGVGSLVAPGSDLLARMIQLQDEIECPLGLVLKEMGEKLPDTHLFNPIELMRKMKRAKRYWGMFTKMAHKKAKKYPDFKNKVIDEVPELVGREPMQVY